MCGAGETEKDTVIDVVKGASVTRAHYVSGRWGSDALVHARFAPSSVMLNSQAWGGRGLSQ